MKIIRKIMWQHKSQTFYFKIYATKMNSCGALTAHSTNCARNELSAIKLQKHLLMYYCCY